MHLLILAGLCWNDWGDSSVPCVSSSNRLAQEYSHVNGSNVGKGKETSMFS